LDPEILKAIEEWAKTQQDHEKTLFFLGGKAYSTKRVLEAVRKDTAEGRMLVQKIHALSLDLIMRGKA